MTYDTWKTTEPDNDVCVASPRCPCLECDSNRDRAADEDHASAKLDASAKILALLDAAAVVACTLILNEATTPGAENALLVWASSRHLKVNARPLQSMEFRWRSLDTELPNTGRITVLVRLEDAKPEIVT